LAQFIDADDPYFRARSADLEDMRERVLRCIDGAAQRQIPPGAIVVARDLVPSRFLETDWQGGGIALTGGSAKTHLAMLARSRGVPMLIGTPAWDFAGHSEALLDTETATLIVSPDAEVRLAFAARMNRARLDRASLTELGLGPAKTRSQVPIKVQINIADARELEGLDPGCCDGIGLVRTELLLRTRAPPMARSCAGPAGSRSPSGLWTPAATNPSPATRSRRATPFWEPGACGCPWPIPRFFRSS
jgi:phosphotransferase system enzyme I (PtsI)